MNELLIKYKNAPLSVRLKEYIFESYKVYKNMEDNPDDINQRLINAKDLISTRLQRKTKRIDDLIAI